MSEILFFVEQAPEGGYTAHIHGESIFTGAGALPELCARVQGAVHCHFDEGAVTKVIRLHIAQKGVLAT